MKLPCTSCVKYHTLHICSFNKDLWTEEDQRQRSIRFLPDAQNVSPAATPPMPSQRFSPALIASVREHQDSTNGLRNEPTTDQIPANTLEAIIESIRKELRPVLGPLESELWEKHAPLPLAMPSNFTNFEYAIGLNPYSDPFEKVNFYQQETLVTYDDSKMENVAKSGPLSWLAVVRRDPAVADLLHFIHVRSRKFHTQDKTNPGSGIAGDQNAPLPEHPNSPFQILTRIRKFLLDKFDPFRYKTPSLPIHLGLTCKNHEPSEVGTEQGLKSILPPKKIVWALVDRFFRVLYPYYPYLDEKTFKNSLTQILGPRNTRDDNYALMSIKEQDYITIGIFCVILRLSYLSLISNNIEINKENMTRATGNLDQMTISELLSYPIGVEFIVYARSCLNKFQLLQKSTLELLQLAIFMAIYSHAAPEHSDGPERNRNIYVGLLVQMGYALGLHRDPDVFRDVYPNAKLNNIRRKIWLFLRYIDAVQSLTLSTPLNINDNFSDTKFPFLDEHNGNSSDTDLDYYTHESMRPLEHILPLVKELMELVLDIRLVSMAVLTKKVSQLEVVIYHKLGTFKDFYKAFHEENMNSDFSKMLQLPFFVLAKFHLAVFHFSLYSIFENSGEWKLAFFYFKKIVSFFAEEFIPYYLDLVDGTHFYFEHAYQLLLNLQLSLALNKAHGILFSFILRVNYTAQVLESESLHRNKEKTGKLRVLSSLLAICSKILLIGLSKMDHRLSFAWKKVNMSSFVLKLVNEEYYKFWDSKDQKKPILVLGFSDDQIDELSHFIELIMTKHDLHKLIHQWSLVKETTDMNRSNIDYDRTPQDVASSLKREPTRIPNSMGISLTPRDLPGSTTETSNSSTGFDPVNQALESSYTHDLNHVMESYFQSGDPFTDFMSEATSNGILDGLDAGIMF